MPLYNTSQCLKYDFLSQHCTDHFQCLDHEQFYYSYLNHLRSPGYLYWFRILAYISNIEFNISVYAQHPQFSLSKFQLPNCYIRMCVYVFQTWCLMSIYLPICIAAYTHTRNGSGNPLLQRHMLIRELCVAASARPEIATLTSLTVTKKFKARLCRETWQLFDLINNR